MLPDQALQMSKMSGGAPEPSYMDNRQYSGEGVTEEAMLGEILGNINV